MITRNPKNERVKRIYSDFLKHSDGKAESTIRLAEKAIQRYEDFTGHADFRTFNQQKAKSFKANLSDRELAKATILSTVIALKRFLGWLAREPGYKSRISLSDIEFLSLSDRDIRAAKAPADRAIPTLEQVIRVVETMPHETAIEKRDRALISLIASTGIRDGAVITLRLKHLNLSGVLPLVRQNPNEVNTKNRKLINAFLLPIDDRFKTIFLDWVNYLKTDLLFGHDHPMFPKTAMAHDADDCFTTAGLSREFWANATPVRDIFKSAFLAAGLPYYSPHTFRHMLMQIAYQRKLNPAQLKAWSQNLGHESLLTSLTSYGTLPLEMQGQLIAESAPQNPEDDELAEALEIVRLVRSRKKY